MSKLSEKAAMQLVMQLVEHAGVAVPDTKAAVNVLVNTWDDRVTSQSEHGHEALREERQAQRENLRDALWSWMAKVYQAKPQLEDGADMSFELRGGVVCYHPKHDFELFTFTLETKGPPETF